mmetsp:Transcript_41436/g.84552  ORF Transcript_41436/g.84552 Transcript_41436/m.84552 type:complete len:203 (+) Transcript_41436:767-1375(+)
MAAQCSLDAISMANVSATFMAVPSPQAVKLAHSSSEDWSADSEAVDSVWDFGDRFNAPGGGTAIIGSESKSSLFTKGALQWFTPTSVGVRDPSFQTRLPTITPQTICVTSVMSSLISSARWSQRSSSRNAHFCKAGAFLFLAACAMFAQFCHSKVHKGVGNLDFAISKAVRNSCSSLIFIFEKSASMALRAWVRSRASSWAV